MGRCIYLRKGEVHTVPVVGIQASDLPIGQIVKLMEGGVETEFIVVHQGIPGSMYDSSCDGTWLLRKDVYSQTMAWDFQYEGSGTIVYDYCSLKRWLNNDYMALLGSTEQATVKEVKVPYVKYVGSSSSVVSGAEGAIAKAFPLSASEVGWTGAIDSTILADGSRLAYFLDGNSTEAKNRRIGYLSGSATSYWTRSPKGPPASIWEVRSTGENTSIASDYTSGHVRPALIIPSTSIFDGKTYTLLGGK